MHVRNGGGTFFIYRGFDETLCLVCSLSSDEEKNNSEDESDDRRKKDNEEENEDNEEEEMEKKLAELKAEEVAELKRYSKHFFFLCFSAFFFSLNVACLLQSVLMCVYCHAPSGRRGSC